MLNFILNHPEEISKLKWIRSLTLTQRLALWLTLTVVTTAVTVVPMLETQRRMQESENNQK